MNNKKGSVLLLVLLVMMVSSLLAILITKYAKNMIINSNELSKYYNAYYLAYGGVELQLIKINNHQMGFEDEIMSGSKTITNNFACNSIGCNFSVKTTSKSNVLTPNSLDYNNLQCPSDKNLFYELSNGEGIIIPLFYDNSTGEGVLSGGNTTNISKNAYENIKLNLSGTTIYSHGIAIVDDNSIIPNIYTGSGGKTLMGSTYDPNKKSFLVIANSGHSGDKEHICIESNQVKLPTSYVVIDSVGRYLDRTVSIKATKKVQLDDYLVYSLIGSTPGEGDFGE